MYADDENIGDWLDVGFLFRCVALQNVQWQKWFFWRLSLQQKQNWSVTRARGKVGQSSKQSSWVWFFNSIPQMTSFFQSCMISTTFGDEPFCSRGLHFDSYCHGKLIMLMLENIREMVWGWLSKLMHNLFWFFPWQAVAHDDNLSVPFLEYIVDILNHVYVFGEDDTDQGNISDHLTLPLSLSRRPQAATLALQEVCRYIGPSLKKYIRYAGLECHEHL